MLGSGWYHVDIVFRELPAHPQLKNDPLAKQMPHNQLYLYRMRELHLAHSVLYISNVYVIDNLYSRLKLATGGVSGAILGILGEGGQKAAAAFRHWRTLEDSDDISRRTMVTSALPRSTAIWPCSDGLDNPAIGWHPTVLVPTVAL